MMIGEIGFDDLYYPSRMVIQPTKNPIRPFPDIGNNFTIRIQNLSFEKGFKDVNMPTQKFPKFKDKSYSLLRKTPNFENHTYSFLRKATIFGMDNSFLGNGSSNGTDKIPSGYIEFNETLHLPLFLGYEQVNETIQLLGFSGYEEFNETMKIPITEPKSHFTEYSMPNLFDADVNTSPKPPFLPGTGIILLVTFIYLVPIVMFNLLVGLAIDDVQVILDNFNIQLLI